MSFDIDFSAVSQFGVCEDSNLMELPWLAPVKQQALACLDSMTKGAIDTLFARYGKTQFDPSTEIFNNIIAFTGDRGTGKTTAMLSFLDYIRKMRQQENGDSVLSDYPSLVQQAFISLPMIDPSRLSDGEGLLGVIVANIYSDIHDMARSKDFNTRSVDELRSAASLCIEVFQTIRMKSLTLKESIPEFSDDTDFLSMFSTTVKLRKSLYTLVDAYLKLKTKIDDAAVRHSRSRSAFLVIPIDDLDTNIANGYFMAEELNHFLMLPNIIIMLSVKMEQLSDLVEQKFMADYSRMLEPEIILDAQPAEMAVRYLQKLIPMAQRIAMPKLLVSDLKNATIKYADPTSDNRQSSQPSSIEIETKPLVKTFIELIRKKTGIILVEEDNGAHPLIPLNLRALHHAFHLLYEMKNIDLDACYYQGKPLSTGDREKLTRLEDNLNRTEQWLLDSISSNAVPRKLANLFRRAAEHPARGFCAFIVHQFAEYSIQENQLRNDTASSLSYCGTFGQSTPVLHILNAVMPEKTITVGDIFLLLDRMLEINSGEGYRHFAAAIKMLISIRVSQMLFAKTMKEEFVLDSDSISEFIGDLIVNPNIKLTPRGNEWRPNIDMSVFAVNCSSTGDTRLFNGANVAVDESFTAEQAKWLSFFVVSPYRIFRNDPHLLKDSVSWGDRIPYFLTNNGDGGMYTFAAPVSFHWLRFITAVLNPEKTMNRLLWLLPQLPESPSANLNLCIKTPSELPLPLYSMDVIHSVVKEMEHNRYNCMSFLEETAPGDGEIWIEETGYPALLINLKESYKIVLSRALAVDENAQNIQGILINTLENSMAISEACQAALKTITMPRNFSEESSTLSDKS